MLEPLFEFSGACAGCGETPYLKLLSQLFGDRIVVANATGCSSIYGANLPTTPWTANRAGRGPAWNNSLFEDAAEFGLGMRLGYEAEVAMAEMLLRRLGPRLPANLRARDRRGHPGKRAANPRPARARGALNGGPRAPSNPRDEDVDHLLALACSLVRKAVWIVGGDGWAYDIGFGGLDHVLASGRNVNVLVLDTEVYSNTGGQASKATSRAAVAKFASLGKGTAKKDLGAIARAYGDVYVAKIALGANDAQAVKVLLEAERLAGTLACDCLQHLHRPGHRHVQVDESHERRGALRLLAPVPLPAHRERERPAVRAGLGQADIFRCRPLRQVRPALRSWVGPTRRVRSTCWPWRRPTSTSAGATTSSWPPWSVGSQKSPAWSLSRRRR